MVRTLTNWALGTLYDQDWDQQQHKFFNDFGEFITEELNEFHRRTNLQPPKGIHATGCRRDEATDGVSFIRTSEIISLQRCFDRPEQIQMLTKSNHLYCLDKKEIANSFNFVLIGVSHQ